MNHHHWIKSWHEFLNNQPLLHSDFQFTLPQNHAINLAEDENYWTQIQKLFPKPQGHINLNNGGVCSNPIHVEQAFLKYYSLLNTSPSFYTWKVMEQARDIVKQALALSINCKPNEIALFRNATEALNNAIFGIQLQANDEVVACEQDYIKCVSSWKQRALREQIKINWVSLSGQESNDEVIAKYVAAFTPKTKVLHLTHVINWNGMILPIEAISKEAKKRNIIVLLDAAHSYAVLETDVQKIDCDYLGTALHKWLSGPIAAGMLFVKEKHIAATYPLASAVEPLSNNIKKFEEMSIQVLPNLLALGHALEIHFSIGREVKEARLRYLCKHWTSALKSLSNLHFHLPLNDSQCAAIASFYIDDKDPIELEKQLFDQYGIHVVGFYWPNLSGIRITPNIYTSLHEVDQLILAIRSLCKQ